jgi:NADH-quinone oxidoreductase subunit G
VLTLTIDGSEVQVAEGTNLVEAAAKIGIDIPTYCYHPGLSVVGQCRICFVEVEGMPRLVTACSTEARDGMVVQTASQRVKDARAAVMEFLLENHPLDCPVCDQAGECYLQDYSIAHGLDTTHMVDERRTFPGLERRLIGPHVVQNQNRCIHCTRCVRFTQEISETHDLTMKSRGNHSYIDTFDGGPFDNPWSACAADVCPVGALTVKEFRFRARVWHLEDTESICPGCSIGCNVTVGHLKREVHRFLPRHNPAVNGWWMCDYGRCLAQGIEEREVTRPAVRSGGEMRPIAWSEALPQLVDLLRSTPAPRVVASANLSNEALYLVRKVFVDRLGLQVAIPVDPGQPRKVKDGHRRWVASIDAHPNSTGARLLGLRLVDATELRRFAAGGDGPLFILDERAHPWLASYEARSTMAARTLAVSARHQTVLTRAASLLLPAASWVETEGTYTSSTGRVQLARQAFPPGALAWPAWRLLHGLAVAFGAASGPDTRPERIFAEVAATVPAFAGMTYRALAAGSGLPVAVEVPDVG